jgi:hypothetical protein
MDQATQQTGRRWPTMAALAASVLLLVACAASRPGSADPSAASKPVAIAPARPAARPTPAPAVAAPAKARPTIAIGPAPGRADFTANGDQPVSLACRSSADCAIKDVGSCCGIQPRCVNKDSPTHPEAVKARCAREGRVSTCAMMVATACDCVAGKCTEAALLEHSGQVQ